MMQPQPPLSVEQQAATMAKMLLLEMQHPVPLSAGSKTSTVSTLKEAIPDRADLSFQMQDGADSTKLVIGSTVGNVPSEVKREKGYNKSPVLDGGYSLFGLDPLSAFTILAGKENDPVFQNLLRDDILAALRSSGFRDYLEKQQGLHCSRTNTAQLTQDAGSYPIVIKAYLEYAVRDRKLTSEWLLLNTLTALAEATGTEFIIWKQGTESKLTVQKNYQPTSSNGKRIDIALDPKNRNEFSLLGFEGYDLSNYPNISEQISPASAEIIGNDKISSFYCMSHGDFEHKSLFDTEHIVPYAKLKENQENLITFLNDSSNADLVDAFLRQPYVSNYLRRNPTNRQVEGTSYFYNLCYNNLTNLTLLCRGCNGSKSDGETMAWFESHDLHFGKEFTDAITAEGGCHQGLIFPRIYAPNSSLSSILIGGNPVFLHTDPSQGLGEFAAKWFQNKFKDSFEMHRTIYNEIYFIFADRIKDISRLISAKKNNEAKIKFKELKSDVNLIITMIDACSTGSEPNSPSIASSDSFSGSLHSKIANHNIVIFARSILQIKHKLQSFGESLKSKNYDKGEISGILSHCWEIHKDNLHLTAADWQTMILSVEQLMSTHQGARLSSGDVIDHLNAIIPPAKTIEELRLELSEEKDKLSEAQKKIDELELRVKELEAQQVSQQSGGHQQVATDRQALASLRQQSGVTRVANTSALNRFGVFGHQGDPLAAHQHYNNSDGPPSKRQRTDFKS